MYRYTFATLALIGAVAAQNSTAVLPLLAFDQQPILASVIASDSAQTTYSLACPTGEDSDSCNVPPSFTVTAGPSTIHYGIDVDFNTLGYGVSAAGSGSDSIDYACALTGTTSGVCTVTEVGNLGGASTSIVNSTTITDASDLGYVTVTITAGPTAANAAASTTGKSSSDESSSSSGAAKQTANAGMPMITANAQWAFGAAAALALGAM